MFLMQKYRGGERGVARILLQTATDHCIKNNCICLYLGTMDQFKGAQRFYEKNGFIKIYSAELPIDFPHNSLDAVFYKKNLD